MDPSTWGTADTGTGAEQKNTPSPMNIHGIFAFLGHKGITEGRNVDLQTSQVFSLCVTAPGIGADLELKEVSSEYLGAGWVLEPWHGALSACAWL